SLITGIVALVLSYLFTRRSIQQPNPALLDEWQARASDGGTVKGERSGSFDKSEMAHSAEAPEEDGPTQARAAQHLRKCAKTFAIVTPLAFLGVILILVLPTIFPSMPALRGGDAAGLVGGVGFVLMMAACLMFVGGRRMLDLCPDYMTDGFVFAFKAMGSVLPIAGFFFLGTSD